MQQLLILIIVISPVCIVLYSFLKKNYVKKREMDKIIRKKAYKAAKIRKQKRFVEGSGQGLGEEIYYD